MPTKRKPEPKVLTPDQLLKEERAADERDELAITKLFRMVFAEGVKPDCRKMGRVRATKPKGAKR